jgi:hypothetical protein
MGEERAPRSIIVAYAGLSTTQIKVGSSPANDLLLRRPQRLYIRSCLSMR